MFLSETCFGMKFREFASIFFPRNGFPRIFLLCGTVRKGIPRAFCSAEWFRTTFRDFASIFVPWFRIPSIFLLYGTVRNGIPRVFCSAEQPEFRQNKPIVPSFPSSAEYFFVGNCQPYSGSSSRKMCFSRGLHYLRNVNNGTVVGIFLLTKRYTILSMSAEFLNTLSQLRQNSSEHFLPVDKTVPHSEEV